MKKKSKTKASIASKYILLIVTILCVGLIFLTMTYKSASEPLKTIVGYTVVPIQKGMNQIGTWLNDRTENFQSMKEIVAKNKKLQKEVDKLTVENSRLSQSKYELERLQKLYELDQSYADYNKTAAKVIGKDSGNWFSTFIIDKGKKDGIKKDMNVIAGSGLVGIVTEVGPNWSTVRSIIDDSSNVRSMLLSTSDQCMVRGNLKLMNNGVISVEKLANNGSEVTAGEQVVTSNVSSKYLEGLLIGYITEVHVDSNSLTKSGYVTPVVDFKKLREVMIITDLKKDLKGK